MGVAGKVKGYCIVATVSENKTKTFLGTSNYRPARIVKKSD